MINIPLNSSDFKNYTCTLWRYIPSLSQLYIRLYDIEPNIDEHMYLGFHSVAYFCGPTKWEGTNYRKGTNDEFSKLIELGKHITSINNSIEHLNLHIFEGTKLSILILAHESIQIINKPIKIIEE